MVDTSADDFGVQLQYDIDGQTLEVRGAVSSVRDTLTQLGFTFSWRGGPHWELCKCEDYPSMVSKLSDKGIGGKLHFKSVSGWNLVENSEADSEWEHLADGIITGD